MYLILKNSLTVLSITFLVDTLVYECVELQEKNVTSEIKNLKIDKDDFTFNDILYLTPYIEDDRLEEAIADSEVKKLPEIGHRLKSYSGFLTVNKKFNSNLFFWFFPPLSKDTYSPVILWVAGGPGDSSVRSMFIQNGPLASVDADGNPYLRNYTWNREFAVLYIDQPVGTGFSFTDCEDGYARDSNDAARDLYEGLRQFFTIFHQYRPNALYLSGYSYACRFHTALANRILEMNNIPATKIKMNLQGVTIGGGFCDPRHHYDVADYIFQTGLIDTDDYAYYWLRQMDYVRLISQDRWVEADNVLHDLYYGYYFGRGPEGSYFHNVTGYGSMANLLITEDPPEINYFRAYLNRRDTKRALHVGRLPFNSPAGKVARTMYPDIAHSAEPQIESLLNANVRMLFYNGNLDLVTPLPAMKNVMRNLQWKGSQKYLDAPSQIYRINSECNDDTSLSIVAGYVRQADNLQFVTVRNAGHMPAFNQPQVTLDLITRFVKRINFNSALTKI